MTEPERQALIRGGVLVILTIILVVVLVTTFVL